MDPPQKPQNLTKVLNVRITAAERADVLEQAALAGLTVSAYCRRLVLGRVVTARVDTTVIGELRRLGGLLKHVHVESGGAYSQATADAHAAVRDAIERVARS